MNPLTAAARATAKASKGTRDRDDAIRAAHAEGHSLRKIAAATGLSFQRVHQIVQTEGSHD